MILSNLKKSKVLIMKFNSKLFIFLTILQYLIDIQMYPCNVIKGNLILYFHHLVNIYIYFGGFLFNPFYHLIIIIITLLHWLSNDNKCFLTEWSNKICYPEYTEYKSFNDFSQMLGIQQKYPNISYYYLCFVILYDIIMIHKYSKTTSLIDSINIF